MAILRFFNKLYWQLLVWIDQGFSVLTGGYADETFSARCWRRKDKERILYYARIVIDFVFFFQKDHCQKAYLSEKERKGFPAEYRDNVKETL